MNFQGTFGLEDTNESILNNLITTHGDELKRIAYLYLHDLSQAEDIVQEVFISCYKNLDKFNHQSSYKTWLYRITINKCKDYQRKWSYKNILYKSSTESYQNDFVHSVQIDVENQEEQHEIMVAISKLPAKYKEVLIFYYYHDMPVKEISEVTNIKVNTVKSRITRGRQILKDELERRGFNFG
ncbi:sigma-70 family RNA polymerase sigma factor [Ornithinibacillus californiensis]|uniref:sigma-70 family RNA polymerase sigma factor n=1 Tax=Ornithinibacillus californiensis TaxID=161536 RepID=UPI00064DE274|nr:sigma-70 family RNA polymerase sigma factor [Ornithinibacillus californiensis]